MPKQKRLSSKKKSGRQLSGKQADDPAFRFSVEEIANMHKRRQKKSSLEKVVTGGIVVAAVFIMVNLFVYFYPDSPKVFASMTSHMTAQIYSCTTSCLADLRVSLLGSMTEDFLIVEKNVLEKLDEMAALQEENKVISSIDYTTELGDISRFSLEPVFLKQEGAVYTCMLDTAMGPLLYYSQGDSRWRDYLYGGADPISRYGCGPVCAAMVINSFSSTSVTPVEIADWSLANGCYAPQSGSYHSLIPNSISAYGLQVDSVTDRSAENAALLLRTGHILVALMGRGSLTQNGHFIIIAQLCDNGNVYIADPASFENCAKEWDLGQLMRELKRSYDSGGPLWAVSYP